MTSDGLYHRLFSHPLMIEQLVRDFVPDAMAVGLDFRGLELVPAKFHDPRDGTRREGDIIWRVPTLEGAGIYLHLLLEFQSSIDWWMAVRAQIYQGLLWQQIIRSSKLKAGDRLPPVLSLVLYNGNRPWTAPTGTDALVALSPGSPLWPWQPQIRYHILDMGRFPGEELARRDTLTALLFRLEQKQDLAELTALVDAVIGWFRHHPDYAELRHLFAHLVGQSLSHTGLPGPLPDDLQEMKTMLATLGQEWQRQWKAEGLAEGQAQGIAAGIAKGRAELLMKQLRRRFGPVPAEIEARLNAASPDQLDAWGEALLDADSFASLFPPTAS